MCTYPLVVSSLLNIHKSSYNNLLLNHFDEVANACMFNIVIVREFKTTGERKFCEKLRGKITKDE